MSKPLFISRKGAMETRFISCETCSGTVPTNFVGTLTEIQEWREYHRNWHSRDGLDFSISQRERFALTGYGSTVSPSRNSGSTVVRTGMRYRKMLSHVS